MSGFVVIFSTAGNLEDARKIGQTLVEEGLVACCNIVQSVESIFKWQGTLNTEREVLMIFKTRDDMFDTVEKRIKQLHTYEVPEVIAIPVSQGSKDYLDWVLKELTVD
ncbi:MAG: divalent-cation tolerance protein CutA [wastewater metagenome]|nr:divalent-cation tolerance protein CutA [Candidatus Loosdrechtia aerotolerans]